MSRIFAVLALMVLGACAATSLDRPPEFALADIRPASAGLFEHKLLVMLTIRNPNDAALAIDGYRFDIELNGQPFARGMSGQSLAVDRLSETTTEAMATLSTLDLMRQLLAAPSSDGFRYRLIGTAFAGGRQIPFEQAGELDFLSLR